MSSAMMRMILGLGSGCPNELTGLSNVSTAETARPKVELDEIFGWLMTRSMGAEGNGLVETKWNINNSACSTSNYG